MTVLKQSNAFILALFFCFLTSCRDSAVPRPRGYFRIDLPARGYVAFADSLLPDRNLPVTFEYPVYGKISNEIDINPESGWFNIEFPPYKAKIYLTYREIHNDLEELTEQSYKMSVKNHIIKADAINEQIISNPDHRVYGILYNLKGNTATAVQFYVTDSTRHFLRGSLYFAAEPNSDSLAPVIDFFREDIIHLIETLKWE
ncbi:MAG: gliding motility lipoprotein GldD [Bacteroidales bacterium]|nr:gliding motility lipoprotein GldD [Bacteroidales bacterium]